MKTEWRSYLLDYGAELDDGRVAHFGNPAMERQVVISGAVLADLSHLGVLEARGADATGFLQGQVTNDVRALSDGRSQLGAYCNPKGRVIAGFRMIKRGDAMLMQMPAMLVESVRARLSRFVLTAKVELRDASDDLLRIGYCAPGAERDLSELVGVVPTAVDGVSHDGELSIVRLPGEHPRFELLGPLDSISRLWRTLDVNAAPVGADAWSLLDIRAGVPSIYAQTSESFLPHMINLPAIDGVSFQKGCYTGQEVVARMQFLGRLKRRMYRARADCDRIPPPGTEIYALGIDTGQWVGKVVEAHGSPDGGCEMLAVLLVEKAEVGEVHLESDTGPTLHILDLPYRVENAARTDDPDQTQE